MKSVIAEATTISKAVEEALKKAGSPVEFFIKVVEKPKSGFLGFGSKNAVIALFFKKDSVSKEIGKAGNLEVLKQDSYSGLFNNKNLKVEGAEKRPAQKEQSQRKDQKTQQRSQQRRRNYSNARKNNHNSSQSNSQNRQSNNQATSQENGEKKETRRPNRNNQQRNRNQNQNRNRNNQNRKKDSSGSSSQEQK